MEEKLLELIQKIAEVKGDSNAEVELENKIAFETGKMEGFWTSRGCVSAGGGRTAADRGNFR